METTSPDACKTHQTPIRAFQTLHSLYPTCFCKLTFYIPVHLEPLVEGALYSTSDSQTQLHIRISKGAFTLSAHQSGQPYIHSYIGLPCLALLKKLFSLIDLIFRELLCSHQHWEESRVPISPHTPCPPRHTWHTHTASSAINTIHMLHSMNQRGHVINNYRKCF